MREVGPAFKQLDGDAAQEYIGPARTFLGVLKNQMRLGSLLQGKMTRQLPDGTVITVTSRFGIDTMQVSVPAPEAPVVSAPIAPEIPVPEEISVEVPTLVDVPDQSALLYGCGVYTVNASPSSTYNSAFWWSKGTGLVPIPSPLIGATPSFSARGISPDGQTVVGGGGTYGGSTYPLKWTRSGGSVVIGAAGFSAYGIASTGDIVMLDTNAYVYRSNAAGALTAVSSSPASDVPYISANGEYIVATTGSYPNFQPTAWDSRGRVYVSALLGPQYTVRAISDTGVAVIDTQSAEGGYLWNIHTGAIAPFGGNGIYSVRAISPDGSQVCGWGDLTGSQDTPNTSPAVYYDVSKGVSTVLEPGPQTYTRSQAAAIDNYNGVVVVGGYAAVTGKSDNSVPNNDIALWEISGNVYTLTRVPSPSYPNGGGFTCLRFSKPPVDPAFDPALTGVQ